MIELVPAASESLANITSEGKGYQMGSHFMAVGRLQANIHNIKKFEIQNLPHVIFLSKRPQIMNWLILSEVGRLTIQCI